MISRDLHEDFEAAKQAITDWLTRFEPGNPLIVVPAFNAYEDTRDCLDSLLSNTRPEVPVLLLDDASTDARFLEQFEPLSFESNFGYFHKPANKGFVDSANLAFELGGSRDVVIINSDVVVPAGWLERLQAAAFSGSTVATATPLTNHGSIISVPARNEPVNELPAGLTLAEIDERICPNSSKLYPTLPAAVGHCVYFKRLALDLLGYFDTAFSPGYGEEVDFSQRAIMLGLTNVLADDLFVYHKGSRSFNDDAKRQQLREAHEQLLKERYPWYEVAVNEAMGLTDSPLALALNQARLAIKGYNIAIDATCLDNHPNGTRVLTLELTQALARQKQENDTITLIIREKAFEAGIREQGLAKWLDRVVTVSELEKGPLPAFDLVHRPFQVYSLEDLELLQRVARRFVVTHLDSLSYATPNYTSDADWWLKLRRFTRLTFDSSDGVIFISQEARHETRRQGLNPGEDRECVTYLGLNYHLHQAQSHLPPRADELFETPFILMLGTNYHHKNRSFALRLFAGLLEQYEWPGKLVWAGSDIAAGGSSAEEKRLLEIYPVLKGRVINMGVVDEGAKQWLLEKAALLLYPSTVEGFGMVPFEAAWAGTPALAPRISSPGEILGDEVLYLESFEPGKAVKTVWSILTEPALARQQVEALRRQAEKFTWEKVAQLTWDFYKKTLAKPPHVPGVITAQLSKYTNLETEYRNLEAWSAELNQTLLKRGKGRQLLTRFKSWLKP